MFDRQRKRSLTVMRIRMLTDADTPMRGLRDLTSPDPMAAGRRRLARLHEHLPGRPVRVERLCSSVSGHSRVSGTVVAAFVPAADMGETRDAVSVTDRPDIVWKGTGHFGWSWPAREIPEKAALPPPAPWKDRQGWRARTAEYPARTMAWRRSQDRRRHRQHLGAGRGFSLCRQWVS